MPRADATPTTSRRALVALAGTTVLMTCTGPAPAPAFAETTDPATSAPLASLATCSHDELLDRYDAWLHMERRLLCVEKYGMAGAREGEWFVPADRHAARFDYPMVPGGWTAVPKPSTRAALVMGTVGVFLGPDAVMPAEAGLPVVHLRPDAELVAACAEYIRLHLIEGERMEAAGSDAEVDAIGVECGAAMAPVLGRMTELRATTLEGISARARVLAVVNGIDGPHSYDHGPPRALLDLILRDVAAMEFAS